MSDDSGPKGLRVRVLDAELNPTSFVGTLVRVRKKPEGVVCEVSGEQRRLVVPRRQCVPESTVRFAPPVSRVQHNRDIDDVALPLDDRATIEALDIGNSDGQQRYADGTVVIQLPVGGHR